jgi:hypothetical protein
MQTTVDIPDELFRQAESQAARDGIPVDHLIARALRVALGGAPLPGRRRVAFPLIHSAQPSTLSVEEVHAAEQRAAAGEDAARARAV